MNAKRIVFPVDFSPLSDSALPYAESMARDMGATLLIVHVEEPAVVYMAGESYVTVMEPDRAALKEVLSQIVPSDSSIACEHHLLFGGPAEKIVNFAADKKADLIVMATHGRSGLKHILMGSVAEAVVRKAGCPVFTFKPKRLTETATAKT